MSIAEQTATPPLLGRTRRRAPLQPVRPRHRGRALANATGLLALAALGVGLTVGIAALGLVMFAANLGG